MHELSGGCHCGNISFDVELSSELSSYQPRACDCEFCQKHRAHYLSDKEGVLSIQIQDETNLNRYRQGTGIAEFLLCKKCGVLTAVTYSEAGRLYGSINSQTLEQTDVLGEPVISSPKLLSDKEKIARWKNIWFSDVKIKYSNGT